MAAIADLRSHGRPGWRGLGVFPQVAARPFVEGATVRLINSKEFSLAFTNVRSGVQGGGSPWRSGKISRSTEIGAVVFVVLL